MSVIIYNGIKFSDGLKTLNISQEPVWDSSKTDYLWDHYTIRIEALINPAWYPALGSTPVECMTAIRSCLETPRAGLTFSVNSENLISVPFSGDTIDFYNGPKPMPLEIIKITEQTFWIRWGVETWFRECCEGEAQLPSYLSNRWNTTISIDESQLSKRTVRGKILFRANAGVNPDSFRNLAVPPLEKGFVRTNLEFVVQDDALALAYSFVDEEKNNVPPLPSCKFRMTSRLGTNNLGGFYLEDIVVGMTGPKGTPKAILFGLAANMAISRLIQDVNGKPSCVREGYMMDRAETNEIELRMVALISANQNTFSGLNASLNNSFLDIPFGVAADGTPPDPMTRGTAPLLAALLPMFNDPCSGKTASYSTQTTQTASLQAQSGSQVTIASLIANDVGQYYNASVLTGSAIYTKVEMEAHYEYSSNLHQIGLQSSGTACTWGQMSQPTMKKCIRYEVESVGSKPLVPSPNDINPGNEVLLDADIKIKDPKPLPDGNTLSWAVSGEYIYGVADPTKCILNGPVPPYLNVTPSQTGFDSTQFVTGQIAGLSTASVSGLPNSQQTLNSGGQASYTAQLPPP
jgi:hypothetical protein